MTTLEIALRRLGDELADSGLRSALLGGLAVSVRSEPRFTRDADVVVMLDALLVEDE